MSEMEHQVPKSQIQPSTLIEKTANLDYNYNNYNSDKNANFGME